MYPSFDGVLFFKVLSPVVAVGVDLTRYLVYVALGGGGGLAEEALRVPFFLVLI